ncbi:MAG TPA: tetratricopeptide repeat protein, partial [Gemmatimonadales bacterium]|nr:tetratricopeptide repeat protein [Gemmatimonadales bacterium]
RNLGIAFFRTAMFEEAQREFRRVAELRPSEGPAPFYLGLIAARQDRWNEAADAFRQAVDRSGPRPALLYNLGIALAQTGRGDQAEALLTEAAGRAPDDARIQTGWGIAALKRSEPRMAQQRLARARELWRDKAPPVWYWAATRAEAGAGDLHAALALAQEAVERHPADPVLRNNLAVLLEAAGDNATAEEVLRELLAEEAALPQPFKNLGDLLYRSGRYDDAAAMYERAAALDGSLGDDLFFKLGNLAFRRRDATAARRHWEHAVALNPGHQLARANLEKLSISL